MKNLEKLTDDELEIVFQVVSDYILKVGGKGFTIKHETRKLAKIQLKKIILELRRRYNLELVERRFKK